LGADLQGEYGLQNLSLVYPLREVRQMREMLSCFEETTMREPNQVQALIRRAVDARRTERGVKARLKRVYGFSDHQVAALLLAADPVKPSADTQLMLAAAALHSAKELRVPALAIAPRRNALTSFRKGQIF
jgi:hypothetical protein